ncbi:uncharacterized protein LOC118435395 [Folsomia candida]|uniref:uncharacterized protein LOC118435395 n=1 Tax=Folsomia candida TaxID=158441 RepID=UPI001604BFBA|nr:uncharacterized protein LOC118435395 [Folsomia candida]
MILQELYACLRIWKTQERLPKSMWMQRGVQIELQLRRYLKRAKWTPDTENALPLCLAPNDKKYQYKFYTRSQLGGDISTIVRPRRNMLTKEDKNIVNEAIRSNLQKLPQTTLYKMSKMEFWKNDDVFQATLKTTPRRSKIVLEAILKDVDDTIADGAWRDAEEEEDEISEDDTDAKIYVMRWINLNGVAAGVVCLLTTLEDREEAAKQHVSIEQCTDRFLKFAKWTPDTKNTVELCKAPGPKKYQYKFFARFMMGGCISTFTRPSENILTPKDKNVIVSAILDNLEHLPNPTLYKMSQMDFWKQQQQFQDLWKERRAGLVKSQIVAMLEDLRNTIRSGAWEEAEEECGNTSDED